MTTAKFMNNDGGDSWYKLTGFDQGTGIEFNGEEYGITEDGKILDSEGYPLTPGDWITIAVENTIG